MLIKIHRQIPRYRSGRIFGDPQMSTDPSWQRFPYLNAGHPPCPANGLGTGDGGTRITDFTRAFGGGLRVLQEEAPWQRTNEDPCDWCI